MIKFEHIKNIRNISRRRHVPIGTLIYMRKRFNVNYSYNILNTQLVTRGLVNTGIDYFSLEFKYSVIHNYYTGGMRKSNDVFSIISTVHKIFMRKGLLSRVIKSVNSCLMDIGQTVAAYFINEYIHNTFDNDLSVDLNSSEVYQFDNFSKSFQSIVYANNKPISSIIKFSDIIDYSSDKLLNDGLNLIDGYKTSRIDNSKIVLQSFYKYQLYLELLSCCSGSNLRDNTILNNMIINNRSLLFKSGSLSITRAYPMLTLHSYKKRIFENSATLFNTNISPSSIISFLPSVLNFVFNIKIKNLSKKMRKILKNKRRFALSYVYVKPEKRLREAIHFINKFMILYDSSNINDRVHAALSSIILNSKSS